MQVDSLKAEPPWKPKRLIHSHKKKNLHKSLVAVYSATTHFCVHFWVESKKAVIICFLSLLTE